MNKFFKHLKTVHRHRWEVMRLCFKSGLYWQGLTHDLSKYSFAELIPSVKYWTGTCSPIDMEIKDKGYSMAWLHHKGRNKHHMEYWLDPAHRNGPMDIPFKYVAEMFCDRVAASKVYNGKGYKDYMPLAYFEAHSEKESTLLSAYTYKTLRTLFEMLAEKGEDEVCGFIKFAYRNKRL